MQKESDILCHYANYYHSALEEIYPILYEWQVNCQSLKPESKEGDQKWQISVFCFELFVFIVLVITESELVYSLKPIIMVAEIDILLLQLPLLLFIISKIDIYSTFYPSVWCVLNVFSHVHSMKTMLDLSHSDHNGCIRLKQNR